MTAPQRIAESLIARPAPGQTPSGEPFVSAVKRCLALGAEGEALLRDAFPKVPIERQLTIVLAISYFPTESAASLLKAQAGDPKVAAALRCCAVEAIDVDVVGTKPCADGDIPVPRRSWMPPTHDVSGHIEAMCMYAGESVALVNTVVPASQLVRSLSEDTGVLLARMQLS